MVKDFEPGLFPPVRGSNFAPTYGPCYGVLAGVLIVMHSEENVFLAQRPMQLLNEK